MIICHSHYNEYKIQLEDKFSIVVEMGFFKFKTILFIVVNKQYS